MDTAFSLIALRESILNFLQLPLFSRFLLSSLFFLPWFLPSVFEAFLGCLVIHGSLLIFKNGPQKAGQMLWVRAGLQNW